ncbi:MAG TPA: hypothetical protein VIK14_09870 [Ignavibacteria bacterium]
MPKSILYSKGVKHIDKIQCILILFLLSLMHGGVAHAQWVQTSVLYGGMINSLTVRGTNLFAGTYGDGVWRRPISNIINEAKCVK